MEGLVLGFDLSLNSTGVCIFKDGSPYHYESIVPYPLSGIERLHSNYLEFCRIFSTYRDISCIAFEGQVTQMRYHNNAGSILSLAENVGVFKLAITQCALIYNPDLLVLTIPPGDIKKYATGNSKATKEDMIESVSARHLKKIKSNVLEYSLDDVVDAHHLVRMVYSLIDKNEYEKYICEDYRKKVQLVEQIS